MRKMLFITRNLPPMMGGMERLNYNIAKILSRHTEIIVIGPEKSSEFLSDIKVVECKSGKLWKFLLISLYRSILESVRNKFDYIYCGSGIAILAGYAASKICKAKLVCYLHGLDIVVDSFLYKKIFIFFIKKSHVVLVNSENTKKLAIDAGVELAKIFVLHPGVDMPEGYKDKVEQNKLEDEVKLLMVGRLTPRKGIVEFIELSMPLLAVRWPKVKLLIIGDEPSQALKRYESYKARILNSVERNALQNQVLLLGRVTDEKLMEFFQQANAFIFPVRNLPGDVEGFGMVAIEAAAYGLPTIGFDSGGLADAVLSGVSGWLLEEGDYSGLTDRIIQTIEGREGKSISSDACRKFASGFAWNKLEGKLLDALEIKK